MAERKPTVVEQMADIFAAKYGVPMPESMSDLEIIRAQRRRRDQAMLAALRLLEEALFDQFDGHAEPSHAIGILIARHQAGVDEKMECNQTPPPTRDIQPDEES